MKKTISNDELWVLSYYRASELAGALLFGRLARRCSDPELRYFLTEHFSEEARHSWYWTKAIHRLGLEPIQITETYQSFYAQEIGIPTSMVEILLLTKIFEERIYMHFTKHAKQKDLHPIVKTTLKKMLSDEDGHLDWVIKKLEMYKKSENINVAALNKKYKAIDKKIYSKIIKHEKTLSSFLSK
jgi:rubrerythrin